jgi:hypothetical protein
MVGKFGVGKIHAEFLVKDRYPSILLVKKWSALMGSSMRTQGCRTQSAL